MNDEHKRWSRQYTSNLGTKEFLRLGCASAIWIFMGGGISIAFELSGYSGGSIIFGIFFIAMFLFPFLALRWKQAYSLLRKILGNENLPIEPMPRRTKSSSQPREWWSYLLGTWWFLMLLLLYGILKR